MHPDKGGDPEDFKFLSEAYESLYDTNKRAIYDETLSASRQASPGSSYDSVDKRAHNIPGSSFDFGQGYKFFVYLSLDLFKKGFIKEANINYKAPGRVEATRFDKDFPDGVYVDLTKISYDEEAKQFIVNVSKSTNIRYTVPTVNYTIAAVALPLACAKSESHNPVNIGMLAVSAGNQFAVFSHAIDVTNEFLVKALRSYQSSRFVNASQKDFIQSYRNDFIAGQDFQQPLSEEEIVIAQAAMAELAQRFLSRKDQIDAIKQALTNDSRPQLQEALNREKNPLRAFGLFGDKKNPASSTTLEIKKEEEESKDIGGAIEHKPKNNSKAVTESGVHEDFDARPVHWVLA